MKLLAVYPTCLLVVCQLAALYQNVFADPCALTNHKPIPDINRRDETNELSDGEISINDREIEEDWYGMSTYTLLTHAPGFFKCGGWYPMWIKDVVGDQATVCYQTEDNECEDPFQIEVRNCTGFTVYYLIAAPVHKASYCFQRDSRDPPPFKAIPTVTIHLETTSRVKSELFFECGFSPDQDHVLFYQISWYVNGKSILTHTASNQMSGNSVSNTRLTEKNLLDNGFKAGINIQCGLRAMFGPDQAPGENGLSASMFVGIKLLQATEITVDHGTSASIDMNLTAPIGCGNLACNLFVEAVISVNRPSGHNGGCTASAVSKACGIDPFKTGTEGQRRTIEVFGVVTDAYTQPSDRDTISSINLMVPKMPASPFWSNYSVGTVQVRVRRRTEDIEKKSCSLENDPYLKRFGVPFQYSVQTGIFTLYKHQSEPIEVQVDIRMCTNYTDRTCTCGLAVRVGNTVFVVSKCNSKVWTREFTQCDTNGEVMQVRRREGDQYDIHLPTGARLELTLDIWNSLLNVKIYPSVRDVNNTRGMCGTLSSSRNNVMIKRSGETANSVKELVESWRVPVLDDLFDEDNIKRLRDTYTAVQQYCTCEGTGIKEHLTCSAMSGTKGCGPVRPSSVVKPDVQCTISKRRKRMALMGSATSRRKRQALPVLNEEEAKNFCDQLFGESDTVNICQTVPGVNVNGSKEECVMDILGSKTTAFSNMSLSSVRGPCFHEVAVNPTLSKPDPKAPMSLPVAKMVTAQSCSNDCSGQGTCTDGACVCDSGYGGADCSVDLIQPPDLYTVEDGGHCDLATSSCEELAVYGEVFTGSPNASCRIEKYMVYGDGTTGNGDMLTTVARDEGINEAVCELPKRVKRQAVQTSNEVTAYNITMANTGNIYSNGVVLLVYDSTCISINESTRQWTIQGAYCMYNSKCIPESSPRPDNSCLVCEVAGNERSWIYSPGCLKETSQPNTYPTSSQPESTDTIRQSGVIETTRQSGVIETTRLAGGFETTHESGDRETTYQSGIKTTQQSGGIETTRQSGDLETTRQSGDLENTGNPGDKSSEWLSGTCMLTTTLSFLIVMSSICWALM
ncbi:uncharacterized protein LOC124131985 [Haliotis rufescens]|uniref:uncharacterized protein LOC124131985 n=1 Tax=Haliotis rufescens TaxID=6454 RepID=UPI00201F00A5|nr:uncharacterized protein LOC124131985 [Haliotis rufescens]